MHSVPPPPSVPPIAIRPPQRRGLLEFVGVHKHFRRRSANFTTLHDVTLTCAPGEFVVLVGPSGSGKTTLLNLAAGMLLPDAGMVRLDGQPVTGPGPDRAVVFQDHGLLPWLTAGENIALGLKLKGVPKSERDDRVQAALQAVRLPAAHDTLVHELSGGMRQRIAIARALVLDPPVLLMDEPFAALDAQTRTLLHHHLQELWCTELKTILFVTHSVGEAVRLADRVIVLHSSPGRIRRAIPVDLPHPRSFDSAELAQVAHEIREEIENEVLRVHAQEATLADLPRSLADLSSLVGDDSSDRWG